jgi:hypothetical protein
MTKTKSKIVLAMLALALTALTILTVDHMFPPSPFAHRISRTQASVSPVINEIYWTNPESNAVVIKWIGTNIFISKPE